jgi:hypothetical protein
LIFATDIMGDAACVDPEQKPVKDLYTRLHVEDLDEATELARRAARLSLTDSMFWSCTRKPQRSLSLDMFALLGAFAFQDGAFR